MGVECSAPIPTIDTPFVLCLRLGNQPADSLDHCGEMYDFFKLAYDACNPLTIAPTEPLPTAVGPTALPPACSSYTKRGTCENAGCSWWSNSSCHNNAEPPSPVPPACSSHTDPTACGNAGCYWWLRNDCNAKPDSCAPLDETACTAQVTCKWEGKNFYTP